MRRSVCLLSGGPDALVAAALVRERSDRLHALFVDYGQRTLTRERDAAIACAEWLGVEEFKVIDARGLDVFGAAGLLAGSSTRLTQQNKAAEYVPFRNTIFLSLAVALAETIGGTSVVIGSTGGATINSPDNTPDYFRALQHVIDLGTRRETHISVWAPLSHEPKRAGIARGLQLGVPFELTWSCQNDDDIPCGACNNCVDRSKSFAALNVMDPLERAR